MVVCVLDSIVSLFGTDKLEKVEKCELETHENLDKLKICHKKN